MVGTKTGVVRRLLSPVYSWERIPPIKEILKRVGKLSSEELVSLAVLEND